MNRSTLSHSITPALTTWRDLVSNGPTGPGFDFTDTFLFVMQTLD